MKTPHILLGTTTLCALVAGVALSQPTSSSQAPAPEGRTPAHTSKEQIEHGRYLTAMGDCVACHTEKGGERFAGGRPLQTPFGTVLSANLTPDATGIGGYTEATFYRALHDGVDLNGNHLYPAFPYNHYTNVTREDSDAIFAFLNSIPKVEKHVDRNQLPFPFNIRWLMTFWNWMFLEKGPYRPDPAQSDEWNRGAYLVEGLGHCQACHTPKNLLGGTKSDEAFHGGTFANWFAPDLTPNKRTGLGGWNRHELLRFLRTGNNVHSAASAEMGEVVTFSTSQMTDADLAAVVTYLRSIPPSPPDEVEAPSDVIMQQGRAIWADQCSACHRMDGEGVPHIFPSIKGNPNVQQSNPTTILHFILTGTRRSPTDAAPTPLTMPAFAWKLNDDQVAAVATYARNSWGNRARAVDAEEVADLREKLHFADPRRETSTNSLSNPGPHTLAPANTDSRDNGTERAGTTVPASEAEGHGAAGNQGPKTREGGNPAGVPAGGPG